MCFADCKEESREVWMLLPGSLCPHTELRMAAMGFCLCVPQCELPAGQPQEPQSGVNGAVTRLHSLSSMFPISSAIFRPPRGN